MPSKPADDIRTLALVLRRTNYGEADRILNLLTPEGKISAIARGVRKEKSKLASSIEMFCLVDLSVHKGKGDLSVVTSAKLLKFYSSIIADLEKLELASQILKKANSINDDIANGDLFEVVRQALEALDKNYNKILIEAWFWFNFAKIRGEEINLYRDTNDHRLVENERYIWDVMDAALSVHPSGEIGANEIKLMRLMLTSKLELVAKVRGAESSLPAILYIAKALNKL